MCYLVKDEEIAIWPLHKPPVLLCPVSHPCPAEHREDALQLQLQTCTRLTSSAQPASSFALSGHHLKWKPAHPATLQIQLGYGLCHLDGLGVFCVDPMRGVQGVIAPNEWPAPVVGKLGGLGKLGVFTSQAALLGSPAHSAQHTVHAQVQDTQRAP